MGKKSVAAAERMAEACEKMASVFEEMSRRDKCVEELRAENDRLRDDNRELAAYSKRLEAELHKDSLQIADRYAEGALSGIVIVP
jgi:hypothetical protein